MKRNYGIDLLRLLLMYMVVLLHVLGHGGVLKNTELLSGPYRAAYLLESLAFCAVNGYGMITGYVCYGKKRSISSLLQLWLQVLLYSVGIAACVWILRPEYFSLGNFLNQCFPVFRETYWYVSSYVGLFFLIPILNTVIQSTSAHQARCFVACSFVIVSVIPTILGKDPFKLEWGYSTAWLAYLYSIGALVHKFQWEKDIAFKKGILIYLLCSILTWIGRITMDWLTLQLFGESRNYINMYQYTSPTVILAALYLLLIFRNLKLEQRLQLWVKAASPAAFGVYLIHEHPHFKGHFIEGRFSELVNMSPLLLILSVLAIAFGVFMLSLAIDYIRHIVFLRFKIKERLENLEIKFQKFMQNRNKRRNPL